MLGSLGQMGYMLGVGAIRPRLAQKSLSLTVNNTTGSQAVFTVTGVVQILGMWGEVTTAISANHTAGHLRLNDQTATIDITDALGITLSALLAGTMVYKEALTGATPLKLKDNAAGTFEEPAAAGDMAMQQFIVGKKTAAVTTIDYRYTTTDAPATGVIQWSAIWLPLSADGNLVAA